jgi:hypothetical protein
MACEAANAAELANDLLQWCAKHPVLCVGVGIIIITILPKPVPAI